MRPPRYLQKQEPGHQAHSTLHQIARDAGRRADALAMRGLALRDIGGVARRGNLLAVLRLGQNGDRAKRGAAGIEHDVSGEIEHLFQRTGRDIQQQRQILVRRVKEKVNAAYS